MKIPSSAEDREFFYADLIRRAMSSRSDRVALYDGLKNYYMWGQNVATDPVEYNKLYSHIDLLASFLFSGETTSFVIEVDEDAQNLEYEFETQKAKRLTPALNKMWSRSNMDLVFNECLIWALVFNTMFIKLVHRKKDQIDAYAVEPHSIGVLLEHEPMLDKQPCIVHEFYMTKSDLEDRIEKLPEEEKKKILGYATFQERTVDATTTPSPTGVNNLIIASTQPNVQGNVVNPLATQYDFNPRITEECCIAHEVWVWDTDKCDYKKALMIEGECLVMDCDNPFVPKEHPFIKITPNQIYNYFWGRTEMMYLIPIQEWINERIPEIKIHLQKQTNPPRSASGFSGYSEEKAFASLDNPGGTVFEAQPGINGKIEALFPANINVFEVLDRAEMMFADISGIRELMQGKGEAGVRAMSHANLLVRVGSSRVKKKASILEDAVEKIGYLMFKIMQKYDPAHYKTDKETSFTAGQLQSNFMVKVDSHSSSPIFVEQQIDKAQILFKAGACDREDLIDALKPQNPGIMKKKLKDREIAAAKQQAQEQALEAKSS